MLLQLKGDKMKRLLLAFMLAATTVQAGTSVYFSEVEALTRAYPNTNPLSGVRGVRMRQPTGYRVSICAELGQTLAGAGTINMYYWSFATGSPDVWYMNPQLTETISVTATSCQGAPCRCQTFSDRDVTAHIDGFLEPATNGVTVSGGTTVTVFVEIWSEK